jgi:phosphate-selective porin OprO and OprP
VRGALVRGALVSGGLVVALLASSSSLAESPPAAPSKTPSSEAPAAKALLQPSWLTKALLRPTVLVEADYRVYPNDVEGTTGFALARLRPGLVFTPTPWFRAVTSIEFAGESPTILDAYARLSFGSVEVTFGYSKPPLFASFIYEPVHTLAFPDRAPVVTSFFIRRDLGADVHFRPTGLPLEAWVRAGNGTGSPLGNDNALPAGYGSVDLVLGRAHSRAPGSSEQSLGLRAGIAGLVESARDHAGISARTPMGFTYFRPPIVEGLRAVGEAHLVAYVGPVRLNVEMAAARECRTRDDDGNPSTARVALDPVSSYGLSAELAGTIFGSRRQPGIAPRPEKGQPFLGALEIAVRYDQLWLGRGASDVAPGGSKGGGLALKWWPTHFLSATAAGYVTRFGAAPIEEPEVLWSWGALLRLGVFWDLPG